MGRGHSIAAIKNGYCKAQPGPRSPILTLAGLFALLWAVRGATAALGGPADGQLSVRVPMRVARLPELAKYPSGPKNPTNGAPTQEPHEELRR